MSRPEINIVWLKRDLRSQDHEPLAAAEAAGIPYLILYLFEPTLLAPSHSGQVHRVPVRFRNHGM